MGYINNFIYRIVLTKGANTRTCYPCGFESLEKQKQRAGRSIYLREYLKGNLIFSGADYAWLKAFEELDDCEKIASVLEQSCDNGATWHTYFVGKFTCKQVEWDLDRCRASVELLPDDVYACIEEQGTATLDIIQSLGPEIVVGVPVVPASYEYYYHEDLFCSFPTNPPPSEGVGWAYFWDDCSGGNSTIKIWFREFIWTNCIAGTPYPPTGAGWTLDINDCLATGQSKYVRTPTISAPSFSDVVLSTCNLGAPVNPNDYLGPISAYWELVVDRCDPVTGTDTSYWWNRLPVASAITYDHCRPLSQVVDAVAQAACNSITGIVSDFFEWNPVGNTPDYVAGINYVTGLPNKLTNIMISQKSDIVNPSASQPATSGEITFNELMQMFATMFNAYWFIENNKLRIEHISAYQYNLTYDFTVGVYKKMLIGKNKYSYISEDRPRVEYYKTMEAKNRDFVGEPIRYVQECIIPTVGRPRGNDYGQQFKYLENAANYDAGKFTTDIKYIQDYPSEIASDGWVLLCVDDDGSGTYTVNSEIGLLSNNTFLNNHLSWANLHFAYHRHDRVLLVGIMNATTTNFLSIRPTKQQKDVTVYACCNSEVDGNDLIKTEIGFGFAQEANHNLKTNKLTLTIAY